MSSGHNLTFMDPLIFFRSYLTNSAIMKFVAEQRELSIEKKKKNKEKEKKKA